MKGAVHHRFNKNRWVGHIDANGQELMSRLVLCQDDILTRISQRHAVDMHRSMTTTVEAERVPTILGQFLALEEPFNDGSWVATDPTLQCNGVVFGTVVDLVVLEEDCWCGGIGVVLVVSTPVSMQMLVVGNINGVCGKDRWSATGCRNSVSQNGSVNFKIPTCHGDWGRFAGPVDILRPDTEKVFVSFIGNSHLKG